MSDADREKWDRRYRDAVPVADRPSADLLSLAEMLPRTGRALDVAAGRGQNAIWLARRGLETTALDISPVALDLIRERSAQAVVTIATIESDLETTPLPDGPWDLIVAMNFLLRPLFEQFPGVLSPGGLLLFVQPTVRNLECNPKPSARFLLEEQELLALVRGLEVLDYREAWTNDQRHEARVLARRSLSVLPGF